MPRLLAQEKNEFGEKIIVSRFDGNHWTLFASSHLVFNYNRVYCFRMCAPQERHSQLSEIPNKGPGSLRILYEDLQPNPELIKVSLKFELRKHLHVSPPFLPLNRIACFWWLHIVMSLKSSNLKSIGSRNCLVYWFIWVYYDRLRVDS